MNCCRPALRDRTSLVFFPQVHEGGYEICTGVEGRWYFKRPYGRAIPTLGYQLEDMTDDHNAPAGARASAGALGLGASGCQDRVGAVIGT